MKADIEILPFKIPFKHPFRTAVDTYQHREGILLSYSIQNQHIYSEISPLPSFSEESLEDVLTWFENQHVETWSYEALEYFIDETPFTSIQFGFDLLVQQVKAFQSDIELSKYLNSKALHRVKMNGIIPLLDPVRANAAIINQSDQHINVLKCKVGIEADNELSLLHTFAKRYPNILWRLDANQSFQADDAIYFLKHCKGIPIEYVEQPVDKDDINALNHVAAYSAIPVAADESARTYIQIEELISANQVDYFILKPQLIGSISKIIDLVKLINKHDKRYIFTTSLESKVGRKLVAQIAAAFSQNATDAHGLNTGHLFENDVAVDMKEKIKLPNYLI